MWVQVGDLIQAQVRQLSIRSGEVRGFVDLQVARDIGDVLSHRQALEQRMLMENHDVGWSVGPAAGSGMVVGIQGLRLTPLRDINVVLIPPIGMRDANGHG